MGSSFSRNGKAILIWLSVWIAKFVTVTQFATLLSLQTQRMRIWTFFVYMLSALCGKEWHMHCVPFAYKLDWIHSVSLWAKKKTVLETVLFSFLFSFFIRIIIQSVLKLCFYLLSFRQDRKKRLLLVLHVERLFQIDSPQMLFIYSNKIKNLSCSEHFTRMDYPFE